MKKSNPATTVKNNNHSRVAPLKEDTITPANDIESQLPGNRRRRDTAERVICTCAVLVAICGIAAFCNYAIRYDNFVKSQLPSIRILRLNVSEPNAVATGFEGVMSVTMNLVVFLEASNAKEKTQLLYRDMEAYVAAADGLQFGGVRLADVGQPPENSMTLVVATAMKDVVMDDRTAEALRSKAHMLMIDVGMKGKIDVMIRGEKYPHNYWFRFECWSINQSVIDAGTAPKCRIKFWEPSLLEVLW